MKVVKGNAIRADIVRDVNATAKRIGLSDQERDAVIERIASKECPYTHAGKHISSPSKPNECWYCRAELGTEMSGRG